MRCRVSAVLLLTFAALLAVLTRPTGARAEPERSSSVDSVRARFQEGVKHFDAKEFDQAREAFAEVYAQKPHPAVLLNLAQSELRSGHEADAANHFAQFLRETSPETATRKEAQKGLAEARRKVAELRVSVNQPGAEILIDGKSVGKSPLPGPVFVTAGSHSIEARHDDGNTEKTIDAVAGKAHSVELAIGEGTSDAAPKLAPFPEEDATQSGGLALPADSGSTSGRPPFFRWFFRRPLALVLGGVAVAGLGAGIGFQLAANDAYRSADETALNITNQAQAEQIEWRPYCSPPSEYLGDPRWARYYQACVDYNNLVDRGNTFRRVSWVGFGAAVVGVGGTILYYFLDTKSGSGAAAGSASALELTPVLGPGTGVVLAGGRF